MSISRPTVLHEFKSDTPWVPYTILLAPGQKVIVHGRTERQARSWLSAHHPELRQSKYGVNR